MTAANAKATEQTVTGVRWHNDRLLTFTTTKPENYSFAAGQYARLGLSEGDDTVWRPFSMTSAPAADELEFYGVLVPNGLFTSRLARIAPGAPIMIERQVFGFMTPDRFGDGEDLWMLSTGTGVGPFISVLRDPAVWRRFRNLVIVHGVRRADELSYHEVLRGMSEGAPPYPDANARLRVLEATTRDDGSSTAEAGTRLHGRITTLLESGELEAAAGLPLSVEASRVMMCGNPDMIEDMRKLLHLRGMRPCRRALPGQFVTENYW